MEQRKLLIKNLKKQKRNFSEEELQFLESHYQIAKSMLMQNEYSKGIEELDKIRTIDPTYKQTEDLYALAKEGLAKIEELERQKKMEEQRKLRQKEIKKILAKAQESFEKKEVAMTESYISKILEIDPENIEAQQLQQLVSAYKADIDAKKAEIEEAKRRRQKMVDALSPGKNYYLQKEWYKAILKLEEFLAQSGMDEDLIKEASEMLEESKQNLSSLVDPLLGKARSLKEGQDLKGAYEVYNEILVTDPSNMEALDEMAKIREELEVRAKKVYREAIISESLSLFDDAKEKFQEVQQISPSDSEYYEKATDRLKEYLE
jgi:tetratricopeptide (TPR) repeat protein